MKDSGLKRKLVEIYEIFYEQRRRFILRTKYRFNIMSPEKTLKYIKENKCSIARFGDGEFDLIFATRDLGFQKGSPEFSEALKKALSNKNPNLLLCIPRCMNTIKGCNQHSADFWITWGKRDNHHQKIVNMIRSYAGNKYRFGDSQITRPYIDWESDERAKRTFPMLKSLWEDKEIIIVEGDQTRLGVGNDLFDGAKRVERILAPAIGAFERRNEIKESILKHYHGQLIIMALGPTATILAAEFADMNIQVLDIGNIDIEYEWFLRGAKERIPIPGKFTNEAKDGVGRVFTECKDEKYLSQIIDRVGC